MWTIDYPKSEGYYWLYGWIFKRLDEEPPKLYFVKVKKISNSIIYIAEGSFVWKSEGLFGYWQPVILPELPTLESIVP